MNMKFNKGFTLIELLVVIAVLAVIGTIVTVSLTSSLEDTNQKQCDEFVIDIEEAACVFAGINANKERCNIKSCPPIKLSELISEGLVDVGVDVCTGDDINLNETVSVTWKNGGEKICEYNGVKIYER